MKNSGILFLTLLLNINLSFSQTRSMINLLLKGISEIEDSKEIINTKQAEKIIILGEKSLPYLVGFFSDSTQTRVKSECHDRNLTKGEIAIIMADQIDRMPYALLTGVQNCLFEFCENNSNLIEYYLPWINSDGVYKFRNKYINWLSEDWIKEVKGKERREREKIINGRKEIKK